MLLIRGVTMMNSDAISKQQNGKHHAHGTVGWPLGVTTAVVSAMSFSLISVDWALSLSPRSLVSGRIPHVTGLFLSCSKCYQCHSRPDCLWSARPWVQSRPCGLLLLKITRAANDPFITSLVNSSETRVWSTCTLHDWRIRLNWQLPQESTTSNNISLIVNQTP